jgi:hypothetical protein
MDLNPKISLLLTHIVTGLQVYMFMSLQVMYRYCNIVYGTKMYLAGFYEPNWILNLYKNRVRLNDALLRKDVIFNVHNRFSYSPIFDTRDVLRANATPVFRLSYWYIYILF